MKTPQHTLPLTSKEEAAWQRRFDDLAANFYNAQSNYQQAVSDRADFEVQHHALYQTHEALCTILAIKQRVIAELLAFYPRPLPYELQHDIDLTSHGAGC